jgi:hypothetical protein
MGGKPDLRVSSDFEVFIYWCRSQVLAGMRPFAGKMEAAVIFSVFQNDRPSRPVHPEVSDRVWNMIQRCWERDPFQRMTAADVVELLEAEMQ